jgi:predicted MFS family arabinose efflux permease
MDTEFLSFLCGAVSFLVFVVSVLGTLYQRFFKKESWNTALIAPFGNRTPHDSADSKSVESVDQVTLTKRKKRWLIAIIVVFNILFFYTVYAYILQ